MTLRNKIIHISGYFFATVTTAAVSFFSIPLLIRALGAEQFGRWSLLEPLQLLLSQVMLLGLNYGIIKQVNFDKSPPFFTFTKLFLGSQPFLFLISSSAFFALPLFSFSQYESGWFALLIYAEAVVLLSLAAYRAANEVRGYAIASITRALVFMLGLVIMFSTGYFLIDSIQDVLKWRLAAATVGVILSFVFVRCIDNSFFFGGKSSKVTIGYWYRNAVRYGFPILVTGLLTQVIEFADRYILKAYFDYTTLAHYVIYVKIGAFLNPLIIAPFSLWWPTERFRRQKDPDGGSAFFRRIAIQVLFVLLLSGGVLWLISPWLISWFAPGIPWAPGITLLLITSVVFMGMGYPLNISLLDEGRTHMNIYGVLCGALLHLMLCFLLIPNYGMFGAALATAVSYLAYTLLLNFISQRVRQVPFAYSTMLALVLISFLELITIQSLFGNVGISNYLAKISLYLLFFPLSAALILWQGNKLHNAYAKLKRKKHYVAKK
jgi:O-antigen/teichoic acid export membrane protein